MILFNVSALAKKTGHGIVSCIEQIRNIWKPFYPNRYFQFREGVQKKRFFWRSLPNLFSHQPTPGFLWDLGEQKLKFGSKKAIFGVICFFRGLDLVWKSATPPTHIWEKSQKKILLTKNKQQPQFQVTDDFVPVLFLLKVVRSLGTITSSSSSCMARICWANMSILLFFLLIFFSFLNVQLITNIQLAKKIPSFGFYLLQFWPIHRGNYTT